MGEHYSAFLVWFIILGATDFLDGKIARYLNQCSSFGSLLDSIADLAYYLSAAYFIITIFPEYLMPNISFFIVFGFVFIGSILLPLVKFGRVIILIYYLAYFELAVMFMIYGEVDPDTKSIIYLMVKKQSAPVNEEPSSQN